MTDTVKKSKKHIIASVIIILMAAITAFFTTYDRIPFSYAWAGDSIDISKGECLSDNVFYDAITGEYTPNADDPWIMFSGVNGLYEGVLLTVKDEAAEDIEVTLYWTSADSLVLSESHTKTSVINKGETTCHISLPAYAVNVVRLDIEKACNIEAITLSEGKIIKTPVIDTRTVVPFILKFIVIAVVLYFAYLSHLERVAKGSHPVRGLFTDDIPNGKKHLYEYDYIRTLAAILVIMMHSVGENYAPALEIGDPGYGIIKMILALSLSCNALFIMLSGALILQPKEESLKDFYIKRMGRVLIPTLSYFLFCVIQGYHKDVFADGILPGIKETIRALLNGRSAYMPHMWFVYAILGLYILAPFIRILVSKLTDKELFALLTVGFVFNILTTYLPMLGWSFELDTPIASWLGIFLLGYYMTTEHAQKRYVLYILLGAAALAVTCLSVYFRPDLLFYEASWTPMMWLEGAGVFAFFMYFKKLFGRKNVIIASTAKFNFSVMLIHVLLLLKVILPIGWRIEYDYGHLRWCLLGMIAVCFVMSYVFSVIYDNTAIAAANYVYDRLVLANRKKKNRHKAGNS